MHLNIHDKIDISLKDLPGKYLDFFAHQIGVYQDNSMFSHGDSRLEVRFVNAIPITSEMVSFGNMYHDHSFLYFPTPPIHKIIGIRIEEGSAKILFEDGVSPLILFYVTEILMRNVAVYEGAAFIHASGVLLNNTAYIFPAWGGSGKTDILIQFLEYGAKYLGDDLIIVDQKGYILPYLKPLNILSYNIDTYPDKILKILNPATRRYYRIYNRLKHIKRHSDRILPENSSPSRLIRYLVKRYNNKTTEYIPVDKLCKKFPIGNSKRIENFRIFFMLKKPGKGLKISELGANNLTEKMSHCLRWERNHFMDVTTAYLYAFSEKAKLIEEMLKREKEISKACFLKASYVKCVEVGLDVTPAQLYDFLITLDF